MGVKVNRINISKNKKMQEVWKRIRIKHLDEYVDVKNTIAAVLRNKLEIERKL